MNFINFIPLKTALEKESPLQIVGCINACSALLAKKAGFNAIYVSGAGVANALGLPDLSITTYTEVALEIERIASMVELPIVVDGDTGFGSVLNIERMVHTFMRAGASAVHIEDQAFPKRCGHQKGKCLVSTQEMVERLQAALGARASKEFFIMARTDAIAVEGISLAIERAVQYQTAGVDAIFAEGVTQLEDYLAFTQALKIPVLANITEFGQTPLFSLDELKSVGIKMVLYPLSSFRAMNKAASLVYDTIRKTGSQKQVIDMMQTREELYQLLNYYQDEKKLG